MRPYLANKKDKTFMDDFLLGNDLARYLEPWMYAQLNVVERALLAQRAKGEAANAARHLRELWETVPPNLDEQDRLFETALRGRALEAGGKDSSILVISGGNGIIKWTSFNGGYDGSKSGAAGGMVMTAPAGAAIALATAAPAGSSSAPSGKTIAR